MVNGPGAGQIYLYFNIIIMDLINVISNVNEIGISSSNDLRPKTVVYVDFGYQVVENVCTYIFHTR